MKNILILDGEADFLRTAGERLESFCNHFKVEVVKDAKSAIQRFVSNKINLIITDLKLTGIKSNVLIKHFNQDVGHIPKIILNGKEPFNQDINFDLIGDVDYLDEPYDINLLAEKIYNLIILNTKDFKQKLFTLPSFIKLIEVDKKTCTLTIKSKNKTGYLYFFNGELIETTTDHLNGEEAVYEILDWDEHVISILDKCEKQNTKIYSPADAVLKKALNKNLNKSMEETMNKEMFESAQGVMTGELGEAFISGSFWMSGDGQPLVTYSKLKAVNVGAANALFDRVTAMISNSLKDSEFPAQINKYYLIDLTGNMIALVVQLKEFQWGMLIDTSKASLGLILNVALPKAMVILNKK
jgi:CheY-like chemotaxis protein